MDRNNAPRGDRARAGMGRVALIVIVTILAVFVGYNVYYTSAASVSERGERHASPRARAALSRVSL
mgnify:CR=1 FL=1|jgi:hypothetical protein